MLSHFIFIFCGPVLFGKSTPEPNQNESNSDKKTRMKWICRATSLKWICENDSSFYLINLSNSFLVGFHVCGSLIVHVCHQKRTEKRCFRLLRRFVSSCMHWIHTSTSEKWIYTWFSCPNSVHFESALESIFRRVRDRKK